MTKKLTWLELYSFGTAIFVVSKNIFIHYVKKHEWGLAARTLGDAATSYRLTFSHTEIWDILLAANVCGRKLIKSAVNIFCRLIKLPGRIAITSWAALWYWMLCDHSNIYDKAMTADSRLRRLAKFMRELTWPLALLVLPFVLCRLANWAAWVINLP